MGDEGDFLRVNQPLVDFLALFQQKVDRRVGHEAYFSFWQEPREEQLRVAVANGDFVEEVDGFCKIIEQKTTGKGTVYDWADAVCDHDASRTQEAGGADKGAIPQE